MCYDESSEYATARQHKVTEVACYRPRQDITNNEVDEGRVGRQSCHNVHVPVPCRAIISQSGYLQ